MGDKQREKTRRLGDGVFVASICGRYFVWCGGLASASTFACFGFDFSGKSNAIRRDFMGRFCSKYLIFSKLIFKLNFKKPKK